MTAAFSSRDGEKPKEACPISGGGKLLPYWCDNCQRQVVDKRCPLCGQKTRKIRPGISEVGL